MPVSRIRLRLALWNLAVLGLVLAVTVGAAVISEVRAGDLAVTAELRVGASRAAGRFVHERKERHEHRRGHEEHDDDDDAYPTPGEAPDLLVITVGRGEAPARADGRPIPPGLPDQEALAAALAGEERWSERVVSGVTVRLLSVPAWHDGRVAGAVQVGRALGQTQRALSRTVLILLITGAAGLVLAAGGSAFLAGRAMGPISEALERQRRFLADASHELRTPVAVLRARAELLQREGGGLGPAARDELDRLRRDADELSALLDELLDLARLDAGQEGIALEPIALGDLAEEVATQLAPLAEARGVALTAQASPVWARAHLGRTRQILRALLDNALKHTPAGGSVVVTVDREGPRPRARITDDGPGIPVEHLPRVFDRFYRADAARAGAGAGLGLSIAARLVHLMGGEIRIDSAPGRGTTATVLLRPPDAPG